MKFFKILERKAILLSVVLILVLSGFVSGCYNGDMLSFAQSDKNREIENLNIPDIHRQGDKLKLNGNIVSKRVIEKIKIGILSEDEKWLKDFSMENTFNKSKRLKVFRLKNYISDKIHTNQLTPGKYFFSVRIKTVGRKYVTAYKKSFIVRVPRAFEIEGTASPDKLYKGDSFKLKGKIRTINKMDKLRVGVYEPDNKKVRGACVSISPNACRYNLEKLNNDIKFESIAPGNYIYKVEAKDVEGYKEVIVSERFSISHIDGLNISAPSNHNQGKGFGIKGIVKSKFKIKSLKIGVKNAKGEFVNGAYEIVLPDRYSYNLKKIDAKIKFGILKPGKYTYYIVAEDSKGFEEILTNKLFTVKKSVPSQNPKDKPGDIEKPDEDDNGSTEPYVAGKKLKYNVANFKAIGAQPLSGPCGQYAMAYGRLVIDGSFPLDPRFTSYYKMLKHVYGHGSHMAYWDEANCSVIWTSSARGAYKLALREINRGKPVIIPVQSGYTGNNHFITLIGYVKGTTDENLSLGSFIALDSGSGREKLLSNMQYYDKPKGSTRVIVFR